MLKADVPRYLKLIKHLESWKDRDAHLQAWIALYGSTFRHRITSNDVLAARVKWLAQKPPLSPKTINHRCDTLRNLYRRLDGKGAPTPCDDVEHLPVPKTPIQRVSDALILAVDAKLQEGERKHTLRDAKTRARFRVLVSTGKRPCELMRAEPGDVNLEARVWVVRDAKGGFSPGAYLNDDQRAAWQLFIDADAWGESQPRQLQSRHSDRRLAARRARLQRAAHDLDHGARARHSARGRRRRCRPPRYAAHETVLYRRAQRPAAGHERAAGRAVCWLACGSGLCSRFEVTETKTGSAHRVNVRDPSPTPLLSRRFPRAIPGVSLNCRFGTTRGNRKIPE